MKSFKMLIATLVIAASPAFASSIQIDTSSMSKEQIAELQIQAIKAAASKSNAPVLETAANVSTVARGEAEKWASFGSNIGAALVSTAKELGVAAVDFSKTDLGKIATAIIVYKLIGSSILHVLAGLILILFVPALIIAGRNYVMTLDVKYEYQDWKFLNYIPYKKKIITSVKKVDSSDAFWIFFWTCAATIVSIIAGIAVMVEG